MTHGSLMHDDAHPLPPKRRRFFLAFALIAATLVVAGFTRTFVLPLARHTKTLSSPWFVYVHAALFFAWIGLLLTQATLVASRRTSVHRRLGRLAFGLAPLMVASGLATVSWSASRVFREGHDDAVVASFLGNLMDMALFATLAGTALLTRRNPQTHKRLMLLATLPLLGAAIARIPVMGSDSAALHSQINLVTVILLLSIVGYDFLTRAKVHPATFWGGLFLLVRRFAATPLGWTPQWLSLGRQILNLVPH